MLHLAQEPSFRGKYQLLEASFKEAAAMALPGGRALIWVQ
jgi:hypothetical protein